LVICSYWKILSNTTSYSLSLLNLFCIPYLLFSISEVCRSCSIVCCFCWFSLMVVYVLMCLVILYFEYIFVGMCLWRFIRDWAKYVFFPGRGVRGCMWVCVYVCVFLWKTAVLCNFKLQVSHYSFSGHSCHNGTDYIGFFIVFIFSVFWVSLIVKTVYCLILWVAILFLFSQFA